MQAKQKKLDIICNDTHVMMMCVRESLVFVWTRIERTKIPYRFGFWLALLQFLFKTIVTAIAFFSFWPLDTYFLHCFELYVFISSAPLTDNK